MYAVINWKFSKQSVLMIRLGHEWSTHQRFKNTSSAKHNTYYCSTKVLECSRTHYFIQEIQNCDTNWMR